MIDFEVITSESTSLECGVKNAGCSVKALYVCSVCGDYLCSNPNCFVERDVEYLEDRPRRILCPACGKEN